MTSEEIKVGLVFVYGISEIKIIAMAENYAMVRRKGCIPFVLPIKSIIAAISNPQESKGQSK